jgi:hypothetical protein
VVAPIQPASRNADDLSQTAVSDAAVAFEGNVGCRWLRPHRVIRD